MREQQRRRFQIHLSTALLLMIAAGGMIGLNTYPRSECHVRICFSQSDAPYSNGFLIREFGWPIWFYTMDDQVGFEWRGNLDWRISSLLMSSQSNFMRERPFLFSIGLNVLFWLGFFAWLTWVSESLIRVRSASKEKA